MRREGYRGGGCFGRFTLNSIATLLAIRVDEYMMMRVSSEMWHVNRHTK